MNDASIPATDPEELGFTAAMAELTELVAQLEADALDVDELAQRVARAAELVEWCRERIDATRYQVEEVLVRLDAPVADGPGEDA